MTIQLLTLVALWCGNPSSHDIYSGAAPRSNVTVQDVNQCREKVFQCLEKDDNYNDERYFLNDKALNCLKQTPYPGKDN